MSSFVRGAARVGLFLSSLATVKAKIITFLVLGLLAFLFVLIIGIFQTLIGSTGDNAMEGDYDFISSGTQNLSPAVEELRPLFEKYAEKYGIPEYVDLLMAKTQQESGGKLQDVMQASESLGLPPNTIDDKETSIDVGTQYFAQVLEQAGGDVKLALQSYNFGSGFIDYANEHNNGKYSKELAIEYSRKQYQKVKHTGNYSCIRPESAETGACYGDIGYVDAVMAYMRPSFDIDGDVEEVVEVGTKWIGNSDYVFGGGRSRSEQKQGIFDCSSFVHWSFEQVGVELGDLGSVTTDTLKNKGQRVSYSDAQPGDLVFFDTYKIDGHVAIFVGDGQFIGAQSSTGVSIENMEEGYWQDAFNGRVIRL
ncbi:bifunctional lytic transglycosylase/C40 family peptidase [Alteribacillus bidgolensis]|uniref:NlpC/P60 family protein n=1 Tax=Alteribacillus bidgolensis TaxID=930129 RepID=A0A1G8Q6I1_9BACI|nr:bifunctional lytic transglycosylase/C40 family peptidase [Alteribacillus bidgolensis]SDJ00238.1 NlpC/P60 family protein [Alteribacillus bidgolensis]